jgi:hypothetical protein
MSPKGILSIESILNPKTEITQTKCTNIIQDFKKIKLKMKKFCADKN